MRKEWNKIVSSKPQPQPNFYYPLFQHMSHEHGLTLLDSELADIIRVCREIDKNQPKETNDRPSDGV